MIPMVCWFERPPGGTEGEEALKQQSERSIPGVLNPPPTISCQHSSLPCLQYALCCIPWELHLLYKTLFLSHSVEINNTVMLGFKGEGKRRIKSYWQGRKAYHFRLDLKIDGRLMELILITLSYSLLNHLPLSLLLFFQCNSPCHLASLYLVSAMCLKVLLVFF